MALLALVTALGIGLCLHYGRIGYLPLDQSIVFDGAWRMFRSGQLPYRDYFTPSSLLPIVMQLVFFRVLGVSWFSYCLHAALMNGAFAALSFWLLRRWGCGRLPALAFAAFSAVVMYPPVGVPYGDQHSLFFVSVTVALTTAAIQTRNVALAKAFWASVPLAALAAILSKQNPGLLTLPLLVLGPLLAPPKERVRGLLWCSLGALFGLALLALLAFSLSIKGELAWYFFWELPRGTARGRLLADHLPEFSNRTGKLYSALVAMGGLLLLFVAGLRGAPNSIGSRSRSVLFAFALALLVLLAAAMAHDVGSTRILVRLSAAACTLFFLTMLAAAVWTWRSNSPLSESLAMVASQRLPVLVLALGLVLIDYLFSLLTNNDAENCCAHVFVASGALYATLAAEGSGRYLKRAASAVLLLALFDTTVFNLRTNAGRRVNDFRGPLHVVPGATIDPMLSFMLYDAPKLEGYPHVEAADYRALLEFLRSHQGNFFLLGDSSILYALSNRPSLNPTLWYHPGLAMPLVGTPMFDWYQAQILSAIRDNHCRFLVVEDTHTWTHVQLADFPALERELNPDPSTHEHFGVFEVIPFKASRAPAQ